MTDMDDTQEPEKRTIKFNDREMQALPVTEGQAAALTIAAKSGGVADVVGRVGRIMKKVLSEEDWEFMQDSLSDGEVTFSDIVTVIEELTPSAE